MKHVNAGTFIRYPGSKAKIWGKIFGAFPDHVRYELWVKRISCYCEPFFGSGALGFRFLRVFKATPHVLVNDLDPGIAALWKAVRDAPNELIRMVNDFRPNPDYYYRFKQEDGRDADPVVRGFQKLALHQMSWSGLGFMSGGPLGGRAQRSEYDPACRWSAGRIVKLIIACHKMMDWWRPRFEITCLDFADVLGRLPADAFVYLDPPYYEQGPVLYKHSLSESDHRRLADCLRVAPYEWVLSYDDVEDVRKLYGWASIDSFEMTPTTQTARGTRRKNREIVIRPNGF